MNKILLGTISLCSVGILASCSSNSTNTTISNTPKPTATPVVTQAPLNLYGSTIVKQSCDNLNRADIWAIVPGADTLTETEIKDCMTNIIKSYTQKYKVTAVTLYLADTKEDVDKSSYTLGRCMYYPGGDISNALNVTLGDYSTFTFKYEIHSRADKTAPSALEIEIYEYVNAELDKNPDEDVVNAQAASKYGITVDELNLIWAKVYTYKH